MENSQIIWAIAGTVGLVLGLLYVFVGTARPILGTIRDRAGAALPGSSATVRRTSSTDYVIRGFGILAFAGACLGAKNLYWAYQQRPEGFDNNTLTLAFVLIGASVAFFLFACSYRTGYETIVTVGGAIRNDATVDQVTGDNHSFLRFMGGVVFALIFCIAGPELWKGLPSLRLPSANSFDSYKQIPMPTSYMSELRWHKEDPRKVSFPVVNGLQWHLMHDELPNGKFMDVNTGDPAIWTVKMEGGRIEYTYYKSLSGVKIAFVDDAKKEKSERLVMVLRDR
jgi:hypothetical protein